MRWIALLLLVLSLGCASVKPPAPKAGAVVVRVMNDNFYDARVYVTSPSMFYALGNIPSFQRREFLLPDIYGGEDFRLLVKFTGAPDYLHPLYFSVVPGDTVYFRIAYIPVQSSSWIAHGR